MLTSAAAALPASAQQVDASVTGSPTCADHGQRRTPAAYHNRRELPSEPGLPLGILPEAKCTETRALLAPGDALTFLSDGVVEARSAAGELFGFDRTRAISNQSAEQIAQAAQDFGQEDDITVLFLIFSPAPDLVESIHA